MTSPCWNPYDEGDWHVPVIHAAVEALGGVYVEIGVRCGDCFNKVAPAAAEAHAVDPVRDETVKGGRFWHMNSDEFFAAYDGPDLTVVFIDGDHTYEQASRDYANAMDRLARDGIVFLHDTWPVSPLAAADCGTVWQLARELERSRTPAVTYRRYPGLTVVQRPRLERFDE